MTIKPYSNEFFRFSLSPEEKKTASGKKFIEEMKSEIQHGDRYWIREANEWAVRSSRLDDFLELLIKYVVNTVQTGQGVLF